MIRACLLICFVSFASNAYAEVQKRTSQLAPQRRVAPVARPAMMPQQRTFGPQGQQQRIVGPNQGPQRAIQPGGPGQQRFTGSGPSGIAPTPRSQLYDMVRPAPTMAPRMPSTATPRTGPPGIRSAGMIRTAAIPKPANVRHNPAHRIGGAGLAHNHSAFVFRRGDRAFHRRYYAVGTEWYFYDDPVPEGDTEFVSSQDANVPVCEDQADECF